jgi:prophage regulatory protein
MAGTFYRYPDLVGLGIVSNRMTLWRWTASGNFPSPIRLGPNSVAWPRQAVDAWLKERGAAAVAAVA